MSEFATQDDRFAGQYSTPFLSHASMDSTWQLNSTDKYCNRIDRCSRVQLYQRSRSMQFQVLANPSLLVGLLTRRDMGREIATMSFARYPFSLLDSGHPSMFLGELWFVAWNAWMWRIAGLDACFGKQRWVPSCQSGPLQLIWTQIEIAQFIRKLIPFMCIQVLVKRHQKTSFIPPFRASEWNR